MNATPCRDAAAQPPLTVADVIRVCGPTFLEGAGARLTGVQRRALSDLAACRTAVRGESMEPWAGVRCPACGSGPWRKGLAVAASGAGRVAPDSS